MHPSVPRREFLKLLGQLGTACVGCALAARATAGETASGAPAKKLTPLRERAYCGLICNDQCELFKATRTNDLAAKKAVFEKWKWKEKFGVEFDPDQVFCHGCKAPGKPQNVAHARCTALKCSVERGFESCVQCRKLAACDKELWKEWPDFWKQVQQLQQKYVAAGEVVLS